MNAFEIYCNYAAACRQARELENISRKIKHNAESYISGMIRSLDSHWNGDASKAFIEKEKRLAEKMLNEALSLQQVADTIRRIAQRTYEAEMRALELSRKRSYS